MIEIVKGPFFAVNGEFCKTLKEAQRKELLVLLFDKHPSNPEQGVICDLLIEESARVVDILTMTKRSLPKARKINGGSKKRATALQKQLATAMASEPCNSE